MTSNGVPFSCPNSARTIPFEAASFSLSPASMAAAPFHVVVSST